MNPNAPISLSLKINKTKRPVLAINLLVEALDIDLSTAKVLWSRAAVEPEPIRIYAHQLGRLVAIDEWVKEQEHRNYSLFSFSNIFFEEEIQRPRVNFDMTNPFDCIRSAM